MSPRSLTPSLLILTAFAPLAAHAADNLRVLPSAATGKARLVTTTDSSSIPLPAARGAKPDPVDFFRVHGALFGVTDPDRQLARDKVVGDALGHTHTSFRQVHRGLPVFGAVTRVHADAQGAIRAVNGTFIPDITVDVTPRVTPARASDAALATVKRQVGPNALLTAKAPKLMIYRTNLARGIPGTNHLAYEVEVGDGQGVREFVYVDAHKGIPIDRIAGVHTIDREVYNLVFDPASLVWSEGDPFPTGNGEYDNIIAFSEDAYNVFATVSGGFLSWDGAGATMYGVANTTSTELRCPNAAWSGTFTHFCTGVSGDDTVAHEWSHAYTDGTHDLIYQWQPGALNESYSDIWGEIVDQLNGAGTDTPNTPRLDGECTSRAPVRVFEVNSPPSVASPYAFGLATYNPTTSYTVIADVQRVNDGDNEGGAGSVYDGCQPFVGFTPGRVALVDRGRCAFHTKSSNALAAGAAAVILINIFSDDWVGMAGSPTLSIPTISVGNADGTLIRDELLMGPVNVTIESQPGIDPSVRWLIGEDNIGVPDPWRDMFNPTCFGDPGKISDEEDYICGAGDYGGVHTNSGVPNHTFALLVDGGTYNGETITGIGLTKAAHIYWRAQSLFQVPTTNFTDHADALEMSCLDLIGVNLNALSTTSPTPVPSGISITLADCTELAQAIAATELLDDPAFCGFEPLLAPGSPVHCDAGTLSYCLLQTGGVGPVPLQDFESGMGDWTVGRRNVANPSTFDTPDWAITTGLPGGRPGHAFHVPDLVIGDCKDDDETGVLYLQSPLLGLPPTAVGPRIRFTHWMATESRVDGGNVKISVNNSPFILIPRERFFFNGYNDTLLNFDEGNTNPLAGQPAFTGADEGVPVGSWGVSLIDLTGMVEPGEDFLIRFEMGLDGCNGQTGWFIDDVEFYGCEYAACCNISETGSCDEFALADEALCTSMGGTFTPNALCTGDCNGNLLTDACEVANFTAADCNGDLVPDECQLFGNDTNDNAIPDDCDGFTIVYVDADATGMNDGSSWADAYTSLQDALAEAASFPGVSNLWIAAGTYHPDEGAGIGLGDRSAKFVLEEGFHLFGGFAGGETSLGERDPLTNRTVLSGDLMDNDDRLAFPGGTTFDDNSYQVLFSWGPEDIVLDGLVISGGNGRAQSPGRGGGMEIRGGLGQRVRNCIFEYNQAETGGGLAIQSALPRVYNCVFQHNHAYVRGGGLSTDGVEGPGAGAMANCIFRENSALDGAGAYTFGLVPFQLVHSTFYGNRASGSVGGLWAGLPSGVTAVRHCIFHGNSASAGADTSEDAQLRKDSASLPINYCLIQGLTGALGGTGNIDGDPAFLDPDAGNFHLTAGSPAIDAAPDPAFFDGADLDNDGDILEPLAFDAALRPRQVDDPLTPDAAPGHTADLGALEYFPDCNANGLPDVCDLDCAGGFTPDACNLPGCGESHDVDANGRPDECLVVFDPGDWSDPRLWDGDGPLDYPDDGRSGKTTHVAVGMENAFEPLEVVLDVPAAVASLKILGGANTTLSVTRHDDGQTGSGEGATPGGAATGNLKVAGGATLKGTLAVASNRIIEIVGARDPNPYKPPAAVETTDPSPWIVGPEGVYQRDPTPFLPKCSAKLKAKAVLVLSDRRPTPVAGGKIALTNSMSVAAKTLDLVGTQNPSPWFPSLRFFAAGLPRGPGAPPDEPPTLDIEERVRFTGDAELMGDGLIRLAGDWRNRSLAPDRVDLSLATVLLDDLTGTERTFEVAGRDVGAVEAGFIAGLCSLSRQECGGPGDPPCPGGESCVPHTNFAIGTLELASGANVRFVDRFDNRGDGQGQKESIYIDTLRALGTGNVLTVDGCKVYYRELDAPNLTPVIIGDAVFEPVVPDAPLPPLAVTSYPHAALKQRYISFAPDVTHDHVSYQVTDVGSASAYYISIPRTTPPSVVGQGVTIVVSNASPILYDWTSLPAVHVSGCMIAPGEVDASTGRAYEVRATRDGVIFSAPLTAHTAARPTAANARFWADVVGLYSSGGDGSTTPPTPANSWTPPNRAVSGFDISAALQGAASSPTAPHLTWGDINPELTDRVANGPDTLRVVNAFGVGTSREFYPFAYPQTPTTLHAPTPPSPALCPAPPLVAAGRLYWSDQGTGRIQGAYLDGLSVEDLVVGATLPRDVVLHAGAGHLYWVDATNGRIMRADLDGSNVVPVVTGLPDPTATDVDALNAKLYWADATDNAIRRSNLNGSGAETVVPGLSSVADIALDVAGNRVYWVDKQIGKVQRANLDGSNVQDLVTGLTVSQSGIALDLSAGRIYWINNDTIWRAQLDGSGPQLVLTTSAGAGANRMVVDASAQHLYWSEGAAARIMRAKLDGTQITVMISGLGTPTGVALSVP